MTELASTLATKAHFWRIDRRDGVSLGFTSHDRDLELDGLILRAAPGILPAAIRLTTGATGDDAEMQGALAHDTLTAADLAAGRFDRAKVTIGTIDWETGEAHPLFWGTMGDTEETESGFLAQLRSNKAALENDPIPRTSPTCRARFCGPGCNLSPMRFTHEAVVAEVDKAKNGVRFAGLNTSDVLHGKVRWLSGPATGLAHDIIGIDEDWLLLESLPADGVIAGVHARLREGCDRTIATCSTRFTNAENFRGEPFLPGNDHLARYPSTA